jgi:hypothetical protein
MALIAAGTVASCQLLSGADVLHVADGDPDASLDGGIGKGDADRDAPADVSMDSALDPRDAQFDGDDTSAAWDAEVGNFPDAGPDREVDAADTFDVFKDSDHDVADVSTDADAGNLDAARCMQEPPVDAGDPFPFNNVPAVSSSNYSYLSVYAGRPPNGYLSRRQYNFNAWDTGWTVYHPIQAGVGVIPTAEPAAVAFGPQGSKVEAVCVRRLDSGPPVQNEIWCSIESSQNGDWMPMGLIGTVAGPALAVADNSQDAQDLYLYLFGIDCAGRLEYRSRPDSSDSWSSFAVVPGAPTDLSAIAATGVGTTLYLCGRRPANEYWCTSTNDLTASTTWSAVPGFWTTPPALGSNSPGLNLAGMGASTSTEIYVTSLPFGMTWTPQYSEHGDLNSAASVVGWGNVTLHIFARARSDNEIWYTYYDGSWVGTWLPIP